MPILIMMNNMPTIYTVVIQKLENPVKGIIIITTIAPSVNSNARVKLYDCMKFHLYMIVYPFIVKL